MVELSRTVKYFGPQWFAPVMGIGALTLCLKLSSVFLGLNWLASTATVFAYLTAGLTVLFSIPWVLRFYFYRGEVIEDFSHPIRSQFFPTMPISLILVGVILQRVPTGLSESLTGSLSLGLFLAGSTGILVFGAFLAKILFTNTNIETKHGVFAWFIPPVSHIIIPVLGFLLLTNGLSGLMAELVYITSLAGLGIGTFMFLFLTPVILHRYAYEDLPDIKLAPTFLIGIAPTSILIINLEYLIKTIHSGYIEMSQGVINLLQLLIAAMWGFSAWWLALTLLIIIHYIRKHNNTFQFTWWAYTFPLGAFTIATGITSKIYQLTTLQNTTILLTAALFTIIVVNSYHTIKMMTKGEAFQPEE